MPQKRSSKNYKKAALLVLFSIIICVGVVVLPSFFDIERLRIFLAERKYLSYPVFILLQVFQGLSIFIPLSPLTIAGGIAFGSFQGFLLSWIGVLSSQIIAFSMARSIGRELVERKLSGLNSRIIKLIPVKNEIRPFQLLLLIALYFSGFVSFDMIAYLLGLSSIKFASLICLSAIGIIPKLLLLNFLGDSFVLGLSGYWLIGISAAFILIVMGVTVMLFSNRK